MQHATQKRGRTTTMVEEANLRKGARSIKPAMRAPWQTRSEKTKERQAKLRAAAPSRSRSIRLDRSKARRASVEGKKKKKKRMVVKPPAPYLLLAVLAVLSGRTTGEMTCYKPYKSGSDYLLRDRAKCLVPEINKEFGGTLTDCSSESPFASPSSACYATAAKINADGSSYTGPDISCYEGYGFYYGVRTGHLAWNSEEDCEEGIKAMTAVLDPPATTTITATTTTIVPTCNGEKDPADCNVLAAGICEDPIVGSAALIRCPALCGSCTTSTTTATATTATTTTLCNGLPDAESCSGRDSAVCSDPILGAPARSACPLLCNTCKKTTATPALTTTKARLSCNGVPDPPACDSPLFSFEFCEDSIFGTELKAMCKGLCKTCVATPGATTVTTATETSTTVSTTPDTGMSTTTGTATSTTVSTTTAVPDIDHCNTIKCALKCEDECGWSRGQNKCVTGIETSASELEDRLGECDAAPLVASGMEHDHTASTVAIVALIVLVVGLSVALIVSRKKDKARSDGDGDGAMFQTHGTSARPIATAVSNPAYNDEGDYPNDNANA